MTSSTSLEYAGAGGAYGNGGQFVVGPQAGCGLAGFYMHPMIHVSYRRPRTEQPDCAVLHPYCFFLPVLLKRPARKARAHEVRCRLIAHNTDGESRALPLCPIPALLRFNWHFRNILATQN